MSYENFIDYFHTVQNWAQSTPGRTAVGYLTEEGSEIVAQEWSYDELIRQSVAVATHLRSELHVGDRALLLFSPGLPFVAAFIGCLASGIIAVPAPLPDGKEKAEDRLARIVTDSGARAVLTESPLASPVAQWAYELPDPIPTIATDLDLQGSTEFVPFTAKASDVAFLQYTSGSTGDPKGVAVTHGNLVSNQVEIGRGLQTDADMSMLSWLPQFHDMGLIGMLLHPLFQGGVTRMLAPITFIKRPATWIRAMSQYRATVSVAPNFAFDLVARRCTVDDFAGVDLSSVRSILNGSEPVQSMSIDRFTALLSPLGMSENAVMPVYGLAEATLYVTGTTPGAPAVRVSVDSHELATNRFFPVPPDAPYSRILVGSGHAQGLEVSIANAEGEPVPPGQVAEICVRGASVAGGYWNQPELSAETFDASIVGSQGGWLRTGDLGVMVDGELFVTGRTKDVIIVNGRNLYAHDIEAIARAASPALARGVGAAFAVGSPERLVLVHEIRAEHLGGERIDDVMKVVRQAVFAETSVPLTDLALVAKGHVARTTSGKIRRAYMSDLYRTGSIERMNPEILEVAR